MIGLTRTESIPVFNDNDFNADNDEKFIILSAKSLKEVVKQNGYRISSNAFDQLNSFILSLLQCLSHQITQVMAAELTSMDSSQTNIKVPWPIVMSCVSDLMPTVEDWLGTWHTLLQQHSHIKEGKMIDLPCCEEIAEKCKLMIIGECERILRLNMHPALCPNQLIITSIICTINDLVQWVVKVALCIVESKRVNTIKRGDIITIIEKAPLFEQLRQQLLSSSSPSYSSSSPPMTMSQNHGFFANHQGPIPITSGNMETIESKMSLPMFPQGIRSPPEASFGAFECKNVADRVAENDRNLYKGQMSSKSDIFLSNGSFLKNKKDWSNEAFSRGALPNELFLRENFSTEAVAKTATSSSSSSPSLLPFPPPSQQKREEVCAQAFNFRAPEKDTINHLITLSNSPEKTRKDPLLQNNPILLSGSTITKDTECCLIANRPRIIACIDQSLPWIKLSSMDNNYCDGTFVESRGVQTDDFEQLILKGNPNASLGLLETNNDKNIIKEKNTDDADQFALMRKEIDTLRELVMKLLQEKTM